MRQLITVEEHRRLRGERGILWVGGPPPDDDIYHGPLMKFVDVFSRTGSIKMARRESKLLATEVDRFIGQSPWFCQQLNAAINEAHREMVVSSLTRATGYTRTDPQTGKHEVDADGRVIYFGASDAMARVWLESPVPGAGTVQQTEGAEPQADALPPLLPSNIAEHRQLQIDDCRMALDALRPAVRAGDRQAIDTFTKVQDRLAKLSGTDAPKANITYINTATNRLSDAELEVIARGGLTLTQGEDGTYSAQSDEQKQTYSEDGQ